VVDAWGSCEVGCRDEKRAHMASVVCRTEAEWGRMGSFFLGWDPRSKAVPFLPRPNMPLFWNQGRIAKIAGPKVLIVLVSSSL